MWSIPNRDLMPPPQLPGDAPGLDVFQPVEVNLFVLLGQDLGGAIADSVERGADDFVGVNEPLVGEHGLDHDFGAVAEGLHDLLGFDQRGGRVRIVVFFQLAAQDGIARRGHHRKALFGDLGDDLFARLKPIQAAQIVGDQVDGVGFGLGQRALAFGDGHRGRGRFSIDSTVVAHRTLGVHQAVHRDATALGDLVVVEVMGAGDLNRARTEVGVGVFICDDRDQPAVLFRADGDFAELANDGGVTLVRGMHRDRAITQHGFGACGRDGNIVAGFLEDDGPVFISF